MIAFVVFRYVMRAFRQEMYRRKSQRLESWNYGYANTEEGYRQVLGIAYEDSLETITKKYKEVLAEYNPGNFQHLGIEFQELAGEKTKEIIEAYEFFRKKYNL